MNTPNPLVELGQYLKGWIALCRSKKNYAELLGVETAQDIHADVVSRVNVTVEVVYKAETYDNEALAAMAKAQAAESEGGVMITPKEADHIRKHVELSARFDHDATEMFRA
jgi:hypothetical protein